MHTPPTESSGPAQDPTDGARRVKKGLSPIVFVLIGAGICLLTVPCLGIAAAIGIPAFVNYAQRSKAAEAERNLNALSTAVVTHCNERGRLPGAAGPLPIFFSNPEGEYPSWQADATFAELGFNPQGPVRFSYAIEPQNGESVVLVARGDLDQDGELSRYWLTCYESCVCDPAVFSENELE